MGQIPPLPASIRIMSSLRADGYPRWFFGALILSDTVRCGPVDDRNLPICVNHASRQSGSCPILAALLIEVAAGTLDCSAVGLSPRPEQV
jgi:hypothetical protein